MNREFQNYKLTDRGTLKVHEIAKAFDECLDKIVALCPQGRELVIVRTKLEEACLFAKKSVEMVDGEPVA